MEDNFGKKIVKGTGKYIKQYYTIKCQHNNQVFDLMEDGKNNFMAISRGADGGKSQSFTFVREGFNFYIKSQAQAKYLTLDSDENGANLYLAPKQKGNKKQLFRIQKDEKDIVYIRTFCDKVLAISTQGGDKKGQIIQWKFTGEQNQQWRLVEPKDVHSSTDEGENLYETKHGVTELKDEIK